MTPTRQYGQQFDEPVTVLFVLPSLRVGGAEIQTIDLANGLAEQGYEVHLCSFDPGVALRARVNEAGVKVHLLKRRKKVDGQLAKEIANLIDTYRIDVVYCSLMIALFWGWVGSRVSKRKPALIAAIHTTVNSSVRAEVFDQVLYRFILRRCTEVVFVCNAQRDHWCKKLPFLATKAVVIHNGIDVSKFVPGHYGGDTANPLDVFTAKSRKVIAHIAGFRPEKGHAILVDAFRELSRRRADVVLVLAGDGPLRPEIERKVDGLGLASRVHFLGVIDDVRPLLSFADCSVVASTSESFPMSVLESMAMQVPVVATDVGGIREAVVPGATGWLVEAGDIAGLANALNECISDEGRRVRFGEYGREKIVQEFKRERMIHSVVNLILRVVRPATPSRR